MSKDVKFSSTIKLNTNFDVSNVIKGLQEIRLAFSGITSTKGKKALEDIDAQLRDIEELSGSMKRQVGQGFSSSKEIEVFDKNLKTFVSSLSQIQEKFQGLGSISLSDTSLSRSIVNLQKRIKDLFTELQKQLTDSLPDSVKKSLNFSFISKESKSATEVVEKITAALQEQLKIRQQNLEVLKQEAKLNARNAQIAKAIKNVSFAPTSVLFTEDIGPKGDRIRQRDSTGAIIQEPNSELKPQINALFKESILEAGKIEGSTATTALDIFKEKLKEFGVVLEDEGAALQNFSSIFDKVNQQIAATGGLQISKADAGRIQKTEEETKAIEQQLTAISGAQSTIDSYDTTLSQLNSSLDRATVAQKKENESVQQGEKLLSQQEGAFNQAKISLGNYSAQLSAAGEQQKKVSTGFDRIAERLKYLMSASSVFFFIRRQLQQTFQDVQNLDKSFAQIAMVTDYYVSDLWKTYDQYAEMANKLGQSTNDVIQASVLFYQQG